MSGTFITLKNYYPYKFVLGDEGESVELRIRRLTRDQLIAFKEGWTRCSEPPSERHFYRKPDADEQEQVTKIIKSKNKDGREIDVPIEVYKISKAEIRRRRMAEMSPEQFEAFRKEDADDCAFIVDFAHENVEKYVYVSPGERLNVESEAGDVAVKTGADLVQVFGGNQGVLIQLLRAVNDENTLKPEEKKALRSRAGSTTSSSEPAKEADGAKQGETAASAGTGDTASTGVA